MESVSYTITNKTEQLEKLQQFLEEVSGSWLLKPGLVFELNLILEEYITNLINYGYNDEQIHEIEIEIIKEDEHLKLIVTDDAGPFDLTETPENTEIEKPVEERRIGGLGIHFIKTLADKIEYQSNKGRNRLVIIKPLT